MSWNLTFQGFMIAGFALVATADFSAPERVTMELVIALAAFSVAVATLLGVRAAQRQSDFLKNNWRSLANAEPQDEGTHILYATRPFADGTGSRLGRLPSLIISATLMVMWLVLALVTLRAEEPATEKIDIRVPEGVVLKTVTPAARVPITR